MIDVVGGTYVEAIRDEHRETIAGSGLRAAQYLGADLGSFFTVLSDYELDVVLASLGSSDTTMFTRRDTRITFAYSTPVSAPVCSGAGEHHDLTYEGNTVVVYGMVDAKPQIRASLCVLDPQHSYDLKEIQSLDVDELHVVLNHKEARNILQSSSTAEQLATDLRQAADCVSVVVKCGALGAFVATEDGCERIPVFPSSRVRPIGSGDVFTAAYGLAVSRGIDAKASARTASIAVYRYCSTGQIEHAELTEPDRALYPPDSVPAVYLAASFASISQRWLVDTATRAIEDIGGDCFSPLRDVGAYTGDANKTFEADRQGIEACQSLLLLIDGARTGPLVEAGIAAELGRPVVIFTEDPAIDRFTMLRGAGAQVFSDLSTAVYNSIWAAIEHQ